MAKNEIKYTPKKRKSPILEGAKEPGGPETPGAKAKRKSGKIKDRPGKVGERKEY